MGAPARQALALTLVFTSLALAVVLRHEPWLDEIQMWTLARTAPDADGFLHSLRFGGHPWLWPALVYGVSHLSGDVLAMQLAHLALAVATVWTVARFAPFTPLQKWLFAAGYYPLFEYAAISRNYAIGMLCVVLACTAWCALPRRYLAMGAALFVLAQTQVYGTILALAFAAVLAGRGLLYPGGRSGTRWVAAVALALAGVAIAVWQMVPAAGSGYLVPWHLDLDPERTRSALAAIVRGVLPLSWPGPHFWNTQVLDAWPRAQWMAGAAILCAPLLLYRRRPVPLSFWVLAAGGLFAFTYAKYLGLARHLGYFFLAWVVVHWVAATADRVRAGEGELVPGGAVRSGVFTALLALNAVAGIYAAGMDLARPFSTGREAAALVRSLGLQDLALAGHPDYCVAPLAEWLGRPMYFPQASRTARVVIYDDARRRVSRQDAVTAIRAFRADRGVDVLAVFNYPVPDGNPDFRAVGHVGPGIVRREEFWLYRVGPATGGGG